MKNRPLLFVLLFICVSYGMYRFGQNQGAKTASIQSGELATENGTPQGVQGEKKPLYWHDPMVPNQRFDKPGKSPFMDMQLMPVYADANSNNGHVSVDSRLQQNLGVRTATVVKGRLASNLTAVGSVAFNERDVAQVQARSNGYVEHVFVRATLDPVKKGQTIADVYVPDWIAAQEEYLTVQHMQADNLDGVLDGARQRMQLAGMSDEQIAQVAKSGKVMRRFALTAPIAGVVTELSIREGMTLSVGAPLFRINSLSTVWINAEVPENLAVQVKPGDEVNALVSALAGITFKGRITAILPEINTTTRTRTMRIELSNPGAALVPGMFATIHFLSSPGRQDVLLVPSEAVIQTGTRAVVMIEQSPGQFKAVDIETGNEANGQTEIKTGLTAGQKVVLSGQFLIDSEASLKGTELRMTETVPETKNQGAIK